MGRPRENKKAVPYDPAFCLVRRPQTGGGTFFYGKALQGREDHAFDILNEESKAHTGNNSTSKQNTTKQGRRQKQSSSLWLCCT